MRLLNHLFALVIVAGGCGAARAEETNKLAAAAGPKSRVVLARDLTAVKHFDVDAPKVRALVAAGIKSLTGQTDEVAAWREFVSSNDVVGIKVNTQAAPLHGSHLAVVEAIADGLRAAGVAATNIVIFDRDSKKLRQAGFEPVGTVGHVPPFRVVSLIPDGWDEGNFYESRLVGKLIWGDFGYGKEGEGLATRSHLPKVLTHSITKLINVPVLQDHEAVGLAGCLYNTSIGTVDNTRRFELYAGGADAAIVEINLLPAVRSKIVLNVMDALVGGYAGGPAFKLQYSWPFGALYFSRDPAAVDALCLEQLDAKRKEAKVTLIGERASYIKYAAKYGLGQNEREKIELVEVGP